MRKRWLLWGLLASTAPARADGSLIQVTDVSPDRPFGSTHGHRRRSERSHGRARGRSAGGDAVCRERACRRLALDGRGAHLDLGEPGPGGQSISSHALALDGLDPGASKRMSPSRCSRCFSSASSRSAPRTRGATSPPGSPASRSSSTTSARPRRGQAPRAAAGRAPSSHPLDHAPRRQLSAGRNLVTRPFARDVSQLPTITGECVPFRRKCFSKSGRGSPPRGPRGAHRPPRRRCDRGGCSRARDAGETRRPRAHRCVDARTRRGHGCLALQGAGRTVAQG